MKKIIRVLSVFAIALGLISCASKSAVETGKGNPDAVKFYDEDAVKLPVAATRSGKYTFVFDITNESKERLSFYVIRIDTNVLDSDGYSKPAIWQEISVPPKSYGVYAFSVASGTEDRCSFQWGTEYKGIFSYSSGSAKLGYGDGKSKIIINENRDAWLEKEGWNEPYHMGTIATGSYTYKEFQKKIEEGLHWIVFNHRNPETNRIQSGYTGIPVYEDEKPFVQARIDGIYKENGLVSEEYQIFKTKKEAFSVNLFESEKKLVGKWEGLYNGLKTTLTLNSDKTYRLDFEDGAWEQWWWNADPSYINLQIYTTKEIIISSYILKDDVLSLGDFGDWKRIE